jgi:hypothetical protein
MKDYPDYVTAELPNGSLIGCKYCAAVARCEGNDKEVKRWMALFIEDHQLSCSWGQGPYQPIPEGQRRLASRLESEKEG